MLDFISLNRNITEVQCDLPLLRGEVVVLGDLPPPADLPLLVLLVVAHHGGVVLQVDLPPPVVLLSAPVLLVEGLGEVEEAGLGGQRDANKSKNDCQGPWAFGDKY